MPAMLALKAYEPTLADVEQRLERRQDTVSAELFARAVAEGLIDETVDQNQLIARLIGPLIFAVLTNETPLTTGLADASLAGVMATLRR